MMTPHRWALLALPLLLGGLALATAQAAGKAEKFKSEESSKFEELVRGRSPVVVPGDKPTTDANREVVQKAARVLILPINESNREEEMSRLVMEFNRRLGLPLTSTQSVGPLDNKIKPFYSEFGAAAVRVLRPLVNSPRDITHLNACRILSQLGRTGYVGPPRNANGKPHPDNAAELMLEIINSEGQKDGHKLLALQGLHNLFSAIEDPDVPNRTVFERKPGPDLRNIERDAIKVLCDWVTKKNEIPADAGVPELDAIRYVRRAAIRGLGFVRTPTVQYEEKVLSRPGLTLLRAASRDGLVPEPSLSERAEALLGYLQLQPESVLPQQPALDVSMYHIGLVIVDLGRLKGPAENELLIPWKWTGIKLSVALDGWQKGSEQMYRGDPSVRLVKEFVQQAKTSVLSPLSDGFEAVKPQPQDLLTWLTTNVTPPAGASLIKSDPTTTITIPPPTR